MQCTISSARLLPLVQHRSAQSNRLSLQPLDLTLQRRRHSHRLLRHHRLGHGCGGRHGGASSGLEQIFQLRLRTLCPRQRQSQLLAQRGRLRAELVPHSLLELIQLIVVRDSLRPSRGRLWHLDVRACSMRGTLEIKCERRQYWEGAGGYQPISWREGAGCQPIVVPPLVPWHHPGAPWNGLAVGLGAPSGGASLHLRERARRVNLQRQKPGGQRSAAARRLVLFHRLV